ncbi:MAG: hypothetical protein IJX62_05805, partial [Clostridia bacterium]|nr:hypothetical protein [Clostridia bacterium]
EMEAAWLTAYGDPIDWTNYARFRYYGRIGDGYYLFYCKNPKASRFGDADRVAYGWSLGDAVLFHTAPFQILRYTGGAWEEVNQKNGLLSAKAGQILADYHRECQQILSLPYQPQTHGEAPDKALMQEMGDGYLFQRDFIMEWSKDPNRPSWYGTYGNCTVIYQHDPNGYTDEDGSDDDMWESIIDSDGKISLYPSLPPYAPPAGSVVTTYDLEVAGCLFEDDMPFLIDVYADGKLYSLEEAYVEGLLRWEELWEISVLHNATNGSLERSEYLESVFPSAMGQLTPEQAARIARIWEDSNGVGEPPVSVDENGEVTCYGGAICYGTYEGGVAIFKPLQIIAGYEKNYLKIGKYYLRHDSPFAIHIFTQDAVMSLEQAYKRGIISEEDLHTISRVHNKLQNVTYEYDGIYGIEFPLTSEKKYGKIEAIYIEPRKTESICEF